MDLIVVTPGEMDGADVAASDLADDAVGPQAQSHDRRLVEQRTGSSFYGDAKGDGAGAVGTQQRVDFLSQAGVTHAGVVEPGGSFGLGQIGCSEEEFLYAIPVITRHVICGEPWWYCTLAEIWSTRIVNKVR